MGVKEAVAVTPGKQVSVGSFVKVASELGGALDIGKVTELASARATVAYFDVPGEAAAFKIEVQVSALRPVALAEQARVLRRGESTGRWQVGRIVEGDGPNCLVAFPNQQMKERIVG